MKPSVQIHDADGHILAEFWDCLRLDPAPTLDLRNRYDEHIRAKGKPSVIIDLGGVGFAGSSALGNFVALQRTARQNGGRVVFCHVDPTVAEVFRASKLDRLFEFTPDREAAIAAVARSESGGAAKPADASEAEPKPMRTLGPASDRLSRLRRNRSASEPE
ncbi:STAS domain-containing protein [Paludisphaera mucosa]|uniref:STAS domain-containing protein n=1 Tax=Paludisphaera mucosa TaxID=3030827 RepID=A0ABT6F5S2_9BACT|nr:STAS domain-containing protein [Paludisphaera mucosa]MDG3002931.1 STAS domain-containing protein [Paludisphaera mucosa]